MNQERLLKIVLAPYNSEKAALATQNRGEYVFKVLKDANKLEIKNAVEFVFNTKVNRVRVMTVKSKPKRFGKIEGKSKAWKKAYVTLQAGQVINLAGSQ